MNSFPRQSFRTALVHHWFERRTGGERLCSELAGLLGTPDLMALAIDPQGLCPVLARLQLRESFLARIPGGRRRIRWGLPLFPAAVSLLPTRAYDLVISSDSFVMKGVPHPKNGAHVCYCHTPMRALWPQIRAEVGLDAGSRAREAALEIAGAYLRRFDRAAAQRVDQFVANSETVRRRIEAVYRREAVVINPPVEVERFRICAPQDYYLAVSRLVPYKRIELAVQACTALKRRLVVVGEGPEKARLQKLAGPGIEFRGWVSDGELAELYGRARALLHPACEDFGIAVVEAQAAGRPVIAFGRGGGGETVAAGTTGLHVCGQTPQEWVDSIREFERCEARFDPEKIQAHARTYSGENFRQKMRQLLAKFGLD